MRDLYARLSLAPTASDAEIKAAITACTHAELRSDAAAVLLHAGRRRTYDQLHATLTRIGGLRASLGLVQTRLWQDQRAFDGEVTGSGSRYGEFIRKQEAMATALRFAQVMKAGVAAPAKSKATSLRVVPGAVVASLIVVTALAWVIDAVQSMPTPTASSSSAASEPIRNVAAPAPVFDRPAVEPPASGTVRRHTEALGESQFEIVTQGGNNYVVALYNAESKQRIVDVFVRGGSTVEVEVPAGTYVLKYAVGSTWYGYEHNFGPETSYNQADSLFRFSEDTGYTVTLYRVANGNLGTTGISGADFPPATPRKP